MRVVYKKNNKKIILVAEDDKGILDAISQLLENIHYRVEQVSDGLKITSRMKKVLPDLFLLDITMPGTDVREVCGQLKGGRLTRHIPIILMSANTHVKAVAKEVGADDYISKPFDISDLLRKIKKQLDIPVATL